MLTAKAKKNPELQRSSGLSRLYTLSFIRGRCGTIARCHNQANQAALMGLCCRPRRHANNHPPVISLLKRATVPHFFTPPSAQCKRPYSGKVLRRRVFPPQTPAPAVPVNPAESLHLPTPTGFPRHLRSKMEINPLPGLSLTVSRRRRRPLTPLLGLLRVERNDLQSRLPPSLRQLWHRALPLNHD
jgi:hypothetical protein